MSRGDASQFSGGHLAGHEGELGALHRDRCPPKSNAPLPSQSQQFLAGLQTVGDGFLTPDVLARLQGAPVDGLVRLHVGQVDQEIERDS